MEYLLIIKLEYRKQFHRWNIIALSFNRNTINNYQMEYLLIIEIGISINNRMMNLIDGILFRNYQMEYLLIIKSMEYKTTIKTTGISCRNIAANHIGLFEWNISNGIFDSKIYD